MKIKTLLSVLFSLFFLTAEIAAQNCNPPTNIGLFYGNKTGAEMIDLKLGIRNASGCLTNLDILTSFSGTTGNTKYRSAGLASWHTWTKANPSGVFLDMARLGGDQTENAFTLFSAVGSTPIVRFGTNGNSYLLGGNLGIGIGSPTGRLHVTGDPSTNDASLTGPGGYLVLGSTTGPNLVLDNNEIMARSNGAITTLNLQADGGAVMIHGGAAFNESERVLINSAGFVGIGTTAPAAPLHVKQSDSKGLWFERDGHDTYELSVKNSKGLHITNITDGGTHEMMFDNGKIGIGTTAPTANLHVVGVDNDGNTGTLKLSNSNLSMILDANEISTVNDKLHLNQNVVNDVAIAGGGGNVTVTGSNSKVGIGIGAPTEKLHVSGTTLLAGPDNNGSTIGTLKLATGTQMMLLDANEIDAVHDKLHLNQNVANDVAIAGGGGNVVMVGVGNVGIGTGTPTSKLHVSGQTLLGGPENDGINTSTLILNTGTNTMLLDGNEIDATGTGNNTLHLNQNVANDVAIAGGGGRVFMIGGGNVIVNGGGSLAVGTATPAASAILDIQSTNKGVLVPRLTTAQRTAISSPAAGLLVYDSNLQNFFFHNGTSWTQIGSGSGDADADPTNELQNWGNLPGIPAAFSDGIDNVNDADASTTNELQTVSVSGSNITLSNGGGTFSINDADASPTNELQNWGNLPGIPAAFADGTDDVNDADADPTNELQNWGNLPGIPVAFSDGIDNVNDADADPTNELQDWSNLPGIPAAFSDGMDDVNDADANPTNELQTISKTGNTVTLSNGGGSFTDAVNDADADPTNELQDWSNLPGIPAAFADGTDEVNDADADPTNELQDWNTLPGIPAAFADGTDDVNDADASPTNELQTISKTGNTVTLSNGGGTFTDEVNDADADATNELQDWGNLPGIPAAFSDGTDDVNDADADPTNELQNWGNLPGIPAAFSDGTDDVNDADSDPLNECNTSVSLSGTTLHIVDANGDKSVSLSSLNKVGSNTTNYLPKWNGSALVQSTSVFEDGSGNVGIGTDDIPGVYKLAVNGSMVATELKVKLQANWPDYVFEKDYPLVPLPELEKSIQQTGHLPGIPSAGEVKANDGMEVGEMQVRLLEKVEELTLYIIQLEKRIKELEDKK